MHSSLLISINPVAQEKTALATNYTCRGLWHFTEIFTGAAHFSDYISAVHTSCNVFIILAFIRLLPSCVNELEKLIFSSSSQCQNNMKFYPLKHVSHFGYIIKCLKSKPPMLLQSVVVHGCSKQMYTTICST